MSIRSLAFSRRLNVIQNRLARGKLSLQLCFLNSNKHFSTNGDKKTEENKPSFEDMLKKMKESPQDKAKDETNEDSSSSEKKESSPHFNEAQAKEFLGRAYRMTEDTWYSFVDNVQEAWKEMTGKDKESVLQRKVQQADSYRKPKKAEDDDEKDDDEEKYNGPSALVLVKEPKVIFL